MRHRTVQWRPRRWLRSDRDGGTRGRVRRTRVCFALMLAPWLAAGAPDGQEAAFGEAALRLATGRRALQDGLYELAEGQFRLRLAEDDLTDEAARAAGERLLRALYRQGKFEAMLETLDAMEARAAAETEAAWLYWRARAHAGLDAAADAEARLDELADRHPHSNYRRPAERLRARLLLEQDRTRDALAAFAVFDGMEGEPEETAANLLEWGRTLFEAQRWAEAAAVLDRVAPLPEVSPSLRRRARYWHGRALLEQERWAEALAVLDLEAESEPAQDDLAARTQFARATALREQGQRAQAQAALSNGVERAASPDLRGLGTAKLGLLLLEDGQIEEGVARIKARVTAAPEAPESGSLQVQMGEILLDLEAYGRAEAEFQIYLETFAEPAGRAQAFYGRGRALFHLGRHAEAAEAFLHAHAESEDAVFQARALFKAGDARFANGQYEQAIAAYRRLIEEHPVAPWRDQAEFQMGQSHARLEQLDRSQSVLLALAERAPASEWAQRALFRVAELQERQGHWREAARYFDQVMRDYPEGALFADALLGRGLMRYQQFQTSQALEDFEALVEGFPDSAAAERAFYLRGLCHYRLLRDDEMRAVMEAFLDRYPRSEWTGEVWFWLGQHYYNQENYAQAEKNFLALTEAFEEHELADHALLRAAHGAARRNEYVLAIEHLDRLVETYPDSRWLAEARFAHGEALRQLGRYAEAILLYEKVHAEERDSDLAPMAWLRKGDCQFMLGVEEAERYRQALRSYRAVANDPAVYRARPELGYEAQYKIGRCLEKLGRMDEALEQFYAQVMVRFLRARQEGEWHDAATRRWFERASLNAVDILEEREQWRQVVAVLERMLEADVSVREDIQGRIERIRRENFWLFY